MAINPRHGRRIASARPSRSAAKERPPQEKIVKGPPATIDKWNQIIASAPDYLDAYYQRGILLFKSGDYPGAIRDLTHIMTVSKSTADIFRYRGLSYLKLGDKPKAFDDLTKSIELKPCYETHRERGFIHLERKELQKAVDDFTAALSFDPSDSDLTTKRGILRLRLNDVERATLDFDKAIELNPRDATALSLRGEIKARKGNFGSAIDDFTKAIKENSSLYSAYLNRANLYRKMGEIDKAFDDITDAININPQGAVEAINGRAMINYVRRNYLNAIADFEKYRQLKAGSAFPLEYQESLKQYSRERLQQGDFLDALKYLEKLRTLAPSFAIDEAYAQAYFRRGSIESDRKNFQGAIADYTTALKLKEAYIEAYIARASAYTVQGEYGKAIADFEKALYIQPTIELGEEYTTAYQGRGIQRYLENNTAGAMEDLNWVIENNPRKPQAYAYRSIIKALNADPEGALEDFDLVSKYSQESSEDELEIAAAPDIHSAVDLLGQLVQLSPDFDVCEMFSKAYLAKGIAAFQREDYDNAILDLERAAILKPGIDIGSEYVASFFKRGLKRFDGGDTEAAIEDYSKAIDLQPSDLFYTRRAQAHYKLKNYENAEADFASGIGMNMSNAECYYGRAMIHFLRLDFGKAKDDYLKASVLDQRLAESCNAYLADIEAKLR